VPQQIGVAFALCAFVVSLGSGLVSDAATSQILIRSVVVLIGATAIGRVLGHCVQTALAEHLVAVTQSNPIPEPIPVPTPGGSKLGEVETVENAESP
jgi:hypothetical protein